MSIQVLLRHPDNGQNADRQKICIDKNAYKMHIS